MARFCSLLLGLLAAGGPLFHPVSVFAQSANSYLTNGNRLVYLDESDPFYPGINFPKLTTPQWVGEEGVDAVVILAIDDMRDPAKYETYMRPILERLKQIDGRAPFSIMANAIKIDDLHLQPWLKEGISIDVHTLTHPFPLLAKGNFQAAAHTYHGCVDLLSHIPGNKPVAFRMPYCDSLNTPSPRFYAELFNSTNPAGQFLSIDSSIMNITTSADRAIPKSLALQADGKERFRKYIPFPSFVTTIENYPYPYVIGRLCWEFPAMVPSDWEARNIHGTNNPITLADWKAALDITVLKQGTFTFIFHPHGWMRPDQYVDFIDYATTKHGKRVKFLSFRDADERLSKNLLAGQSLRSESGADNGVRLIDLNNDGYLDVLIGNETLRRTRIWDARANRWIDSSLPVTVARQNGIRFGILGREKQVGVLVPPAGGGKSQILVWDNTAWRPDSTLTQGLPTVEASLGLDRGLRMRDLDNDGRCELIVGNETQSAVFTWDQETWKQAPFGLPAGTAIVDAAGRDQGLRFIDINEDGYIDVLFSNDRRYSLHLFRPEANQRLRLPMGWTDEIISQTRGSNNLIPMIVRSGTNRNNGVWFHSGVMWVQNEDTTGLPDHVDRRSYRQLLTCDQPKPLSPQESLASIKVHPGFKVELVANEPLLEAPVAFDWGADGKLWVVEMVDYPLGIDGKGTPGGRVRYLEDTDNDGHYDKSTLFLDHLNFPNGIIPWRKGVIVSAAPELFYAEDADADGKADLRKTLFAGFTEGNQQHRANGFDYGLDNWLYGANGDSGGVVHPVAALMAKANPKRGSVELRGHDFRIRPDEGLIETVAGQTQFGRHRNDWGDWFGNNNPAWLWHYYLPEQYLSRNPNLAVRNTKRMLANYPESTRAFPISRTAPRFNEPAQANHVTSGNSATPYRDRLFGTEFANSVFISEPVHNLVHREVLERDGVSFKSHRAPEEQNSEFLASTDNWFRPVMLKTGPDGALYIADMYRLVLEHPEWIPVPMQKRLDLRAGVDKGRIYRVYPTEAKLRATPRLDKLSPVDLVAALDSANGWERDTAQRLLVHSRPQAAVVLTALRKLLSAPLAQTRLQALATLQGLDAVTAQDVSIALKDPDPRPRAFALQAAEPILRQVSADPLKLTKDSKQLTAAILKCVDDPDLSVRYQLAFTLGEWRSPEVVRALVALASRDASTPEMMTAILTSAEPHAPRMLNMLVANADQGPLMAALLTSTSVARDVEAVASALRLIVQPSAASSQLWQFRALAGLAAGLERQGKSLADILPSKSSINLDPIFAAAAKLAANSNAELAERIAATALLGRGPAGNDLNVLSQLLAPQNPMSLQEAALETFKRLRDKRVPAALLSSWRAMGPAARPQALNLLASRPEWAGDLLAAIEERRITAGEIGAPLRQKLSTARESSIRARAQKAFSVVDSDRQALIKQYASISSASGDSSKGMALFRQNCAACHNLHGEGIDIGPDLGAVSGKPNDVLLVGILDPNQAVESRYLSYNVITKNDRELSGIITAETATSVTLRSQGGAEEVLLRSDIKELSSSGISLMPEGFETILPPDAMADLFAAIRSPTRP